MKERNKLVRITTVPISMEILLENQLRFMKQHYEVVGIASDEEHLKRVGDSQNIRVFVIEMTRSITPLRDLKAVWQLYSYFKKEKPLIVHTHTPKAGTLGMIAAKLAGVPHRLHTVAGLPLLEATGFKRLLLNSVEKTTYACATHIYPNSFGLNEIIIREKFCKPEKLKVLGNGSSNGINTSFFDPELFSNDEKQILKTSLGISADDFVFIFVGRLVADKGVNELIHAFASFSAKKQNVKLLLVGAFEFKLDPLSPETLVVLESNANILTLGFQKDVRPYLAISDCLVFPSYREGFPNVVMQAGAMGLPSIVSDINGCNEIILDSENGYIIPVKDSDAIYQGMRKMVLDKDFKNHLKQNSRKMIVSRYEQNLIWEAILKEYKRLTISQETIAAKPKLIRTSTIALSLDYLLKGQLAFLQNSYEVLAVSGQDGHLETVATREGVKTVALELQRNISPLKDTKALWQLYRLFQNEKPLIVHSITPKAGLLTMMAGYLAGVPIRIHTFTGLIFPTKSGMVKQLLITMDKVLCRCATHIYPEGQGVRQDLIRYKITNKPLKVLANGNVNGIDLEYFNPDLFSKEQKQATKTTLGIAPDDFVFIFVGRLVGDKGINELVTAFELFSNPSNSFPIENRIVSATLGSSSHLKRGKGRVVPLQNQIQSKSSTQTPVIPSAVEGSAPNTQHILPSQLLSFAESNRQPTTDNRQPKLLLVGPFESSLDPLQEETLRIINTNKNIIAVGFQKDIRPYLAISDCLVFPSYREGFPNVVMQAGAMNLPSIVTDINGCNEIIIEGENGTIIPVKDRDAVYKAMKKMMENKAFRTQVQGNARNRIISRYEQSVVWNAVLEEYRKLEYDV